MRVRTFLALAATVAAFAIPAHADEGLGSNTQTAGYVAVTGDVMALCFYVGEAAVSGGLNYQLGGIILPGATSRQPMLTDVSCTLTSPARGLPSDAPMSASCETTALPCVANASGWPTRPVVLCIDGYVMFGPTPVVTESFHACKTSTP